MANYYNKTKAAKSKDFQVCDKVSFCVPKIDRCSTDLQRIAGEIVSVTDGEKILLNITSFIPGFNHWMSS